MAAGAQMVLSQNKVLEDPLSYLTCSTVLDFRRGQTIYSRENPSTCIHLVIAGKVKVYRETSKGAKVLVDMYQTDDFFGESALIGSGANPETAVAYEATKLMTWTTDEIEKISESRPKLAIALVQLLVQRSAYFGSRIESFSTDSINRRLARALIHFSERFGHRSEEGVVEMIPLTHELLSQYVGTSREVITQCMNTFRSQGYVRYSRRGTALHVDAIKTWLN